jgi:HSP90 family molecular chaperone
MGFRIQARTILQLGAELISSDAVAFYELIKNSIDAGAKNVRIRIVSVLPHDVCNKLLDEIETLRKAEPSPRALEKGIDGIKRVALSKAKLATEFARERLSAIEDASTLDELEAAINQCSSIEVEDSGSGMSLDALSSVYLTVGTRSRYSERKDEAKKPDDEKRVILGEKGIGRLSAMRLGGSLLVSTTRAHDLFWNTLDIDWGLFSHDSDQLLDELALSRFVGKRRKTENNREPP